MIFNSIKIFGLLPVAILISSCLVEYKSPKSGNDVGEVEIIIKTERIGALYKKSSIASIELFHLVITLTANKE